MRASFCPLSRNEVCHGRQPLTVFDRADRRAFDAAVPRDYNADTIMAAVRAETNKRYAA